MSIRPTPFLPSCPRLNFTPSLQTPLPNLLSKSGAEGAGDRVKVGTKRFVCAAPLSSPLLCSSTGSPRAAVILENLLLSESFVSCVFCRNIRLPWSGSPMGRCVNICASVVPCTGCREYLLWCEFPMGCREYLHHHGASPPLTLLFFTCISLHSLLLLPSGIFCPFLNRFLQGHLQPWPVVGPLWSWVEPAQGSLEPLPMSATPHCQTLSVYSLWSMASCNPPVQTGKWRQERNSRRRRMRFWKTEMHGCPAGCCRWEGVLCGADIACCCFPTSFH